MDVGRPFCRFPHRAGAVIEKPSEDPMPDDAFSSFSRRSFVKTTTLATAGLVMPRTLSAMTPDPASAEVIRVGVVWPPAAAADASVTCPPISNPGGATATHAVLIRPR